MVQLYMYFLSLSLLKINYIDRFENLVLHTGGSRRGRCGHCQGCTQQNCGYCTNCKDMKKFGGLGRKKKACVKRKCTGEQVYNYKILSQQSAS